MPIPTRETFPTDRDDLVVQVTDDGSRTLVKTGTDDSYHSGCGAATETRHVYLENSGIANRLRSQQSARLLEIGLGTSQAMLMTIETAVANDATVDYVALETDWISGITLDCLRPGEWTSNPEILESYLSFRNALPETVLPGVYDWRFDSRRAVSIHVTDVRDWDHASGESFDAIYFDPFCPNSAPELWTVACFTRMRSVIKDDGSLTTYSCSRPVRNALEQAGWIVRRVPGPVGGKREVIIASPA
jgi:tRNA U34 5-methylaminomethyl-2-thiouridine-forming methyltransferase MnmC